MLLNEAQGLARKCDELHDAALEAGDERLAARFELASLALTAPAPLLMLKACRRPLRRYACTDPTGDPS